MKKSSYMLSLLSVQLSSPYWHKSAPLSVLYLSTLQNFAIGLIATVLDREAVLSVALYLLLGAIGLPVFCREE